jgi:hypothetical protein
MFQAWSNTHVIPALRRLKQEDIELGISKSCKARSCLKKKKKKKRKRNSTCSGEQLKRVK